MSVFSVRISEWGFRRLEAGQRALVMPEGYLASFKPDEIAKGYASFEFVEYGYEGKGVECPVNTGRRLLLGVALVTHVQPGMAAGHVLVELINIDK